MTRYLTDKEVTLINEALIKKYTPQEPIGVKDRSLLLSALGRPKQSVFGEDAYPDTYTKAAALYTSLAQNHAFHNANKRTALFSLIQFLWVNGYQFIAPQKVAEDYTVFIVNKKPEIKVIAKFIKEWTKSR